MSTSTPKAPVTISDAALILMVHNSVNKRREEEGKRSYTAIFTGGERNLTGEFVTFGVDTKKEAIVVAREYGYRFLNGAKVLGWSE